MNSADLFVWGFIAFAILIKLAFDNRIERRAAKQQVWRASIWNTVRKCDWCRTNYRIEDGDPHVCSPRCQHQQANAWRKNQTH